MITVFLSFVLSQDVCTKMFGIGLAAAALIDATVVRMVLVPAIMELLGTATGGCPAGSIASCRTSASRATRSPTTRQRCPEALVPAGRVPAGTGASS